MSAAAARVKKRAHDARTFHLRVQPGPGDTYGIDLTETHGAGSEPIPVLHASPAQTSRVIDAVLAAVKASGHTPGRLTIQRDSNIDLDEPAGVRLALTLFATQPLTRHDRIREIVAGINIMSVEETYYWYSKCMSPGASRARRALRILLADDKAEA